MSTSNDVTATSGDYTLDEESLHSDREGWAQRMTECTSQITFGQCAYAFCCPMCAVATARNRYDESNFCFNVCCVTHAANRNIIREGYELDGHCTLDLCSSLFCCCCSAAQLLAETQRRGRVEAVLTRKQEKKAKKDKKREFKGSRAYEGREFHQGLCMCCGDGLGNCLQGCFCTLCMNASVRTTIQPQSDWCFNFCCVPPVVMRNTIREMQRIPGNCCADVCIGCLCTCCSTIQLAHEADRILLLRLVDSDDSNPDAKLDELQANPGQGKVLATAAAAQNKAIEKATQASNAVKNRFSKRTEATM
eukprot:Amastigsp_a510097_58.p2 type:complete len:306 gc:universal Amastigsp_a510097_58:1004-87(-)